MSWSVGMMTFPTYGKIKRFQTTNQIITMTIIYNDHVLVGLVAFPTDRNGRSLKPWQNHSGSDRWKKGKSPPCTPTSCTVERNEQSWQSTEAQMAHVECLRLTRFTLQVGSEIVCCHIMFFLSCLMFWVQNIGPMSVVF